MRNIFLALALLSSVVAVGSFSANHFSTTLEVTYKDPIDALSVHIEKEETAEVRAKTANGWTAWQTLYIEDEQDPTLLESNLVMFPTATTEIQIRGDVARTDLHPIAVSHDPVKYEVAATGMTTTPRILARSDWGADETILYKAPASVAPVESGDKDSNGPVSPTTVSQREKDCMNAQFNYPAEFKTVNRTTKGENGQTLRWTREYSKSVKLLVVHHTAVATQNDTRSGAEKVRALYTYHANNRGWGDVGYHYLIDDDGKIYEGKSGGPMVVGGHAYCNNIGTIGIAMLGNFEEEEPTQEQVHALQWLLDDLSETYNLDPASSVKYHGKTMQPIVGHRDLLSTDCPGYFMYGAMSQVRSNVVKGDLSADVGFPPPRSISVSSKPYVDRADERKNARIGSAIKEGISALGAAAITGRPGDSVVFSVRYLAGAKSVNRRTAIADISASDPTLTLWQEIDGKYIKVRDQILLPQTLAANGTVQIKLKADLPINAGTSHLRIGQATYVVTAAGKRQLGPRGQETIPDTILRSQARAAARQTRGLPAIPSSVSSVHSSTFVPSVPSFSSAPSSSSPLVRIRLSSREKGETSCSAMNLTAIESLYRGTLHCELFNGKAAIINEVELEDYMLGLAEEPDTEPYEKQRAFAIAARTYAAYYLSPDHRKVPGAPYDGTDSPAVFQKYNGISFEKNNPNWLKAVRSTASEVLMKNNQIIKPPYFSSDDGRTRTPEEAGWKNFPFAEVFSSKDDPWCAGMKMAGHGVGMSGCGAEGQAHEGKTGEEILAYYYPGTTISTLAD